MGQEKQDPLIYKRMDLNVNSTSINRLANKLNTIKIKQIKIFVRKLQIKTVGYKT